MGKHVSALGWLQIVLGILDLAMALAVFGMLAGAGLFLGILGGVTLPALGGVLGLLLGLVVAVTALPNLLAGLGLLARKGWARILALVLAVFNIFKFPWGTALALYTFWVLTDRETKWMFGAGR